MENSLAVAVEHADVAMLTFLLKRLGHDATVKSDLIEEVLGRDDGELLRNECSDTSTKSIVSFSGKQRHLGEAAANSLSTNGRNTATAVGRLALMPHARLAASPQASHWPFTHSARDGGGFEMEAQYTLGGSSRCE